MANTVKVTVVMKNGLDFTSCPQVVHLPCPAGTVISGNQYYINSNDEQTYWNYPTTTEAVSPAVGFEVVKVNVGFDEYFVVGDSLEPSATLGDELARLCNTCCGDTEPELTFDDGIPTLNPTSGGISTQDCATGDCTYLYLDLLPANADGLAYTLTFSRNGTTSTSTTFTTIAAALAYAQANWSASGTWSLDGNVLKLTGSSYTNASISHNLVAQSFCLTLVASDEFNQVTNNGVTTNLGSTIVFTNVADLIPFISAYFADGTLTAFSTTKLNYSGTGVPGTIKMDGVVVRTWATGACA